MERILLELDEKMARELERVAPAAERKRAEFIRQAIRRALDLALDRETAQAYRNQPLAGDLVAADAEGWDKANALAVVSRPRKRAARSRRRAAR